MGLTENLMAHAKETARDLSLEELVATVLESRDWHRLSFAEEELVSRMEASGHLMPTHNGRVGKAVRRVGESATQLVER